MILKIGEVRSPYPPAPPLLKKKLSQFPLKLIQANGLCRVYTEIVRVVYSGLFMLYAFNVLLSCLAILNLYVDIEVILLSDFLFLRLSSCALLSPCLVPACGISCSQQSKLRWFMRPRSFLLACRLLSPW